MKEIENYLQVLIVLGHLDLFFSAEEIIKEEAKIFPCLHITRKKREYEILNRTSRFLTSSECRFTS
jgi:hypothetical protein